MLVLKRSVVILSWAALRRTWMTQRFGQVDCPSSVIILNPKTPLDISRDYSATRKALAATLYDFFLSSFPHILTPNLWRPGVRFWSYVTFCTCTSDRKWLQNVILCTKSMQIEFFHIVHINMLIFTLNGWNEFVLALLCFKKCLPQISPKKKQKEKVKKTKKYIRNS